GPPRPRADRLRLVQSGHAGPRRRRARAERVPARGGGAGGHVPAPPAHRGRGPPRAMKAYLVRRLWQSLLVLLGVSVVVFFILHLTGDPAALLLPPDATAED